MVCLMVLNILCLFAFLFGRWYFWCLHVTIFTAKFQFQSSNWCLGTYSSPFEEGLSTSASCAGFKPSSLLDEFANNVSSLQWQLLERS